MGRTQDTGAPSEVPEVKVCLPSQHCCSLPPFNNIDPHRVVVLQRGSAQVADQVHALYLRLQKVPWGDIKFTPCDTRDMLSLGRYANRTPVLSDAQWSALESALRVLLPAPPTGTEWFMVVANFIDSTLKQPTQQHYHTDVKPKGLRPWVLRTMLMNVRAGKGLVRSPSSCVLDCYGRAVCVPHAGFAWFSPTGETPRARCITLHAVADTTTPPTCRDSARRRGGGWSTVACCVGEAPGASHEEFPIHTAEHVPPQLADGCHPPGTV